MATPPEVEGDYLAWLSREASGVERAYISSVIKSVPSSTAGPSSWIPFLFYFLASRRPYRSLFLTYSSLSFRLGPRSPPPPRTRDQSPLRRYEESEVYESERRGRIQRAALPLPDRSRVIDGYGQGDSIPQRRPRPYDTAEYENDIKRRRVDEDTYRRRPSPDHRSASSPMDDGLSSQLPMTDPQGTQHICWVNQHALMRFMAYFTGTRKRTPLPSQTDRFRQIATPQGRPQEEALLIPPPPTRSATRLVESHPRDALYAEAPSAPRGHHVPATGRDDYDREARHAPRRDRPSRFDEPVRREENRDRESMDVDYLPHASRGGPTRPEFPPSRPRSNTLSDRPAMPPTMDAVPKGPRAMARTNGAFSERPVSPSPVISSAPIRMPDSGSASGRMPRPPPPHSRQDLPPLPRGPIAMSAMPPAAPRSYPEYSEDRRSNRPQDVVDVRNSVSRPVTVIELQVG